ncbi:unnamed protein product [Schistosoma intercalatum]|nr:unnamed protein product [Schistosoma intercalatum]
MVEYMCCSDLTVSGQAINFISFAMPKLSCHLNNNLANKLRQHFTHQFSYSLKKPIPNLYSRYLYQYKLKKQNKLLTAAAIDACNLKPGDDVLEIGFGQGYGIKLAAECVAPVTMNHWKSSRIKFILENAFSTSTNKSNTFKNDGHVYGVEISEYMLQKAKRIPCGGLSCDAVRCFPQCVSYPLPALLPDFFLHWDLVCSLPQYVVANSDRPMDLKYFA